MSKRMPFPEEFLHFIWLNMEFDFRSLTGTEGEKIEILKQGSLNRDGGPDFLEATLRVNGILWNGQVEIHIYSSDWLKHGHQHDPKYDTVILHVVWKHDTVIKRMNQTTIPTLELHGRVNMGVLHRFSGLRNTLNIPCEHFISDVQSIYVTKMIESAAIERMERKMSDVLSLLQATQNNWEITAFRFLLQHLGLNKNRENFNTLSRAIPWKHWVRSSLFQKEALIFGLAGLLNTPKGTYAQSLRKEYLYLKYKWKLSCQLDAHQWQFFRMRPANFPTIRMAHFCSITQAYPYLIPMLVHSPGLREIKQVFKKGVSPFWQTHYSFSKKHTIRKQELSTATIHGLILNFFAPLTFAYGEYHGWEEPKFHALEIIQNLPGEKNHLIKQWNALGVKAKNGFESQGLIEMNQVYCLRNRCLDCHIGKNYISGKAA